MRRYYETAAYEEEYTAKRNRGQTKQWWPPNESRVILYTAERRYRNLILEKNTIRDDG